MRPVWLMGLLLCACTSAGAPASTSTAAAPAAAPARVGVRPPADTDRPSLVVDGRLPLAQHWTRTSAEHRAILLQSYGEAEQRLRELAAPQAQGSWAVIMDADETVLDNSPYFQRQAERGYLGFTFASWIAYVKEAISPALPGAVHFTRLVHELGGRVVIITGRAENLCEDTRRNLEKAGIQADAVLCSPRGVQDKNPRFVAVQKGEVNGLPPLYVVMWVGDNVQDFPGVTQAGIRTAPDSAYSEFGHSWWILPNPMYGSWEGNPIPAQR